MLQLSYTSQGLLWRGCCALVEADCPGSYWLCFYSGIKSSGLGKIVILGADLVLPLFGCCLFLLVLILLSDSQQGVLAMRCLAGNSGIPFSVNPGYISLNVFLGIGGWRKMERTRKNGLRGSKGGRKRGYSTTIFLVTWE